MFCLNCGTKLPLQSRFCKECGASQVVQGEPVKNNIPIQQPNSATTVNVYNYVNTPQPQSQPVLEPYPANNPAVRYETCEIFIKTSNSNSQYIAQATGFNGNYVAAKSSPILGNLSKSSWLSKPQLEIITKKLNNTGWLPIPVPGPYWYSRRFSRQIVIEAPKFPNQPRPALPLPSIPGYEVCEIKAREISKFNKIFVALAPDLEGGIKYEVGSSTAVSNNLDKQGILSNAVLQKLCQKLKSEGWQPIEPSGQLWFNFRFRRLLKTTPDYIQDIPIKTLESPSSQREIASNLTVSTASSWPEPPENWSSLPANTSAQPVFEISKVQICGIELQLSNKSSSCLVALIKGTPQPFELFRSSKVAVDWTKPTLFSKPHLDLLVKKLKKEGWVQLESSGEHWYNLRFQKSTEN